MKSKSYHGAASQSSLSAEQQPLIIGIDPGTHTGIAVWDVDQSRLIEVLTMGIIRAQRYLLDLATRHKLLIVMEDARLIRMPKHLQKQHREIGAGSVMRDCKIWEEFAQEYGMLFFPRAKGFTFKGAKGNESFKQLTKWIGSTNDHGRDAAGLVFGYKAGDVKRILLTIKNKSK